jgi:hypothetical protein
VLERALLATWVLHGLGMLSMALVLLPMMPGGPTVDVLDRATRVATHPWLFRLGWLPWHLTAASDLYLAYAFVRTPWIPRWSAFAVAALTLVAVVPDQLGQGLWETVGVELARDASSSAGLGRYLAYESHVFAMTGVWAALLYTVAALGWTACFVSAGTWTRLLTRLSIATWGTFAVVTVGPLLPAPLTLPAKAIAVGNALGFALLMVWLALVTEQVLRASRPETPHGRWARWRAPGPGPLGRLAEIPMNSRFVRRLCSWLPVLRFRSDITDVVYVNYLVPAKRLEAWLPEGLELQRLGPKGEWAMFTFLSYRHGHFGPALLGPLRRLMSSPIQTNWRTYVRDPHTKKEGIYFVTNAVTTRLHSGGARLMSEGMPMHLFADAALVRSADGTVQLWLDPGEGSAPDADATLRPAVSRLLTGAWGECFPTYEAMLRYAVPQDRAMSTRLAERETVREEIDLGIPIDSCEPLGGAVTSRAAEAIVGDATPVCFRVPAVPFRFAGERFDRWPRSA